MNSLPWKRRIAKFYPALNFKNLPRRIILIYHAVGSTPWALPETQFKQQIEWLKENTNIVPLDQILKPSAKCKKIQVALTFDDGYACIYHTVFPILNSAQAVGTIYINTQQIANDDSARKPPRPDLGYYPDEPFLTWNEVKELEKSHWEIGSHGVDHLDLTKEPLKTIQHELSASRATIQAMLQKPCAHFAYTYGKHSDVVRKAVKAGGYKTAVAGHHKRLHLDDDYALPRLNIQNDYSLSDFKNIILGKWDFMGSVHRLKKVI